jgi:hypothetical protein
LSKGNALINWQPREEANHINHLWGYTMEKTAFQVPLCKTFKRNFEIWNKFCFNFIFIADFPYNLTYTSLGNTFLATMLASASVKATLTCLRRRIQQQHAHPTHATATLASPAATIIAPVILPDGFSFPASGIGRLNFDGAME